MIRAEVAQDAAGPFPRTLRAAVEVTVDTEVDLENLRDGLIVAYRAMSIGPDQVVEALAKALGVPI